jgi:hypothetical protein
MSSLLESITNFFLNPNNIFIIISGVIFLSSICGIAVSAFAFSVLVTQNGRISKVKTFASNSNKQNNKTFAYIHKGLVNSNKFNTEASKIMKELDDKLTNNLMAIDSRLNALEMTKKDKDPVTKKKKNARKKVTKKKVTKKIAKKKVGRPRKNS